VRESDRKKEEGRKEYIETQRDRERKREREGEREEKETNLKSVLTSWANWQHILKCKKLQKSKTFYSERAVSYQTTRALSMWFRKE
jgi:hypothetical protein